MISKQVLILLGAVFLIQCSNAAPYIDMDSAVLALKERLVLTKLYMTEFNRITEKILDNGKTIFEKVLKDPKVLDVKTDPMKSNLDELRNFVEEYEKFDKTVPDTTKKYRDIMRTFNDIADKYLDDKDPLNSEEHKIVQQSLKENGLVKTIDFVKDHIQQFIDPIYGEVEKYYNGLEESQKKSEHRLLEWMTKFNGEKDDLKRADHIRKLVEDFDFERFSW